MASATAPGGGLPQAGSPAALASTAAPVQQIVVNQGTFDVAAVATPAQVAATSNPAALLLVAGSVATAASARVEGGVVVLASSAASSVSGSGSTAHGADGKIPPGDPCSRGVANPCNGNNGNDGDQGNVRNPPPP
ncbi:MAG TPA: hypothetical protein VF750_08455, partial [Sphingomicrobium sp.]